MSVKAVCIGLLLAALGLWFKSDVLLAITARQRGAAMARIDWARGHRELKMMGLVYATRPAYAALLRDRYRTHVNEVAGCVVSGPFGDYVEGYNLVVAERLRAEYGSDVVSELAREVEERATE